jgi:hypothetical protein
MDQVTSIQGPGTISGAEELATAPMSEKPGVAKSILGEIYGHPVRNLAYQYYLTPWNIRPGMKWHGAFGWKGIAGTSNNPLNPVVAARYGAGRAAAGITGKVGLSGTSSFFNAFAGGGFAQISKQMQATSPATTAVFSALSKLTGGTPTSHIGVFGYGLMGGIKPGVIKGFQTAATQNWGRGQMRMAEVFGPEVTGGWTGVNPSLTSYLEKNTANFVGNFAGKATALTEKYASNWNAIRTIGGGVRSAFGGSSTSLYEKLAGDAVKKFGLTRASATAEATAFLRGNAIMFGLRTAATASLIYDIGKFATKQTYKLTKYALEGSSAAVEGILSQEWGTGQLSPGFMAANSMTERQRALSEINRSSMNARSLLGNEASLSARTYLGGRII